MITGNIYDQTEESTFCHQCKARIIGRDRYVLTDWQLDEKGRCKDCGAICNGVFEAQPGGWGSRFMPVHMASYAA